MLLLLCDDFFQFNDLVFVAAAFLIEPLDHPRYLI
jgi:hypothetical protein